MRYIVCAAAVMAAILRPAFAAEEEPERVWRSRLDKPMVNGVFWRAEKGIVEIKTTAKKEPVKVKLIDLSAEDTQYLLRNNGGVIGPTTQLLVSGYVMDKNKTVVPLTKYHKRVSGTVKSKISDDMIIVRDLEREVVLSCDATELKKGQRFSGWGYPLKETLTLSNGKTTRIYRAYVTLGNPKQITNLIRKSPLKMARYVTGSSITYRAWAKNQERVRNAVAAEERHTDRVKERTDARTAEVKKRSDARVEEETAKLRERTKRKLAETEMRIKTVESNIRTWEARKRNSKMHSGTYNKMRKKIGSAERDVVLLKKTVREYKAELKELGDK
jgi:hypothetical protein